MFLVEMGLVVSLSCAPQLRRLEDQIVYFDSNTKNLVLAKNCSATPEVAVASDNLEAALARDFSIIPQVRHVLIEEVDNSTLLVWIAIDNPEAQVRRRVYQKELELIEGFPEVNFDFNLMPAMGRTARELATNGHVVFSRSN